MTDSVNVPVELLRRIINESLPVDVHMAVHDLFPPEPAPVPKWMTVPGAKALCDDHAWERVEDTWRCWFINSRTDAEMVERGAVPLVEAVPVEKRTTGGQHNHHVGDCQGCYAKGYNEAWEEVPDLMPKPVTVEQIEQAMQPHHKCGICAGLVHALFYPGQTL